MCLCRMCIGKLWYEGLKRIYQVLLIKKKSIEFSRLAKKQLSLSEKINKKKTLKKP